MADSEAGDGSDVHNSQNGSLRGRTPEVGGSQGLADVPSEAAYRVDRRAPPDDHPPMLDQRFDANSLGLLRTAVARHAAAAGLSADRVLDAVIAAHELAANAVCHGASHGRVRQWTDGQLLYCQVSDPGPADDIAAGLDDQQPWLAEDGPGLWLARQAADQMTMGHGAGGTGVTITFAVDLAWQAGN